MKNRPILELELVFLRPVLNPPVFKTIR
jgi:hypothetical protein